MNNLAANLPLSEQYRLAAIAWADRDAAASILEESKSAVLSQRMNALADLPVSRAEMQVKASQEWEDYIKEMVGARTIANKAKIEMEFLRMRFTEWNSEEANKRTEARL